MSAASDLPQRYQAIIAEHAALAAAIDWPQVEAAAERIDKAKRVFFSAQGRSGLALRAIAIRMMHIGLTVHVAGEPSTPSIAAGDVLLAASASGGTGVTNAHLAKAAAMGAEAVLLTTKPSDKAGTVVILPIRSAIATDQHAGSLFEQAVLMLGDAMSWAIQKRRNVPDAELDRRHANLQ